MDEEATKSNDIMKKKIKLYEYRVFCYKPRDINNIFLKYVASLNYSLNAKMIDFAGF